MAHEYVRPPRSRVLDIFAILALLFFVAALIYALAPWVEKSLQERVEEAMAEKGVSGWSLVVDGRDVIVSEVPGASPSYEQLVALLNQVDGVRQVKLSNDNYEQSWLTGRKFLFSELNYDGNSFTLTGTRPDGAELSFNGQTVQDLSLPSIGEVEGWEAAHQALIDNASSLGPFRLQTSDNRYRLLGTAGRRESFEKLSSIQELITQERLNVGVIGPEFNIKAVAPLPEPVEVVATGTVGAASDNTAQGDSNPTAVETNDNELQTCQAIVDEARQRRKIQFGLGSSAVEESGVEIIRDLVAAIQSCDDGLQIVVEGHTDSSGSAEGNRRLSQQRADSVATQLEKLGVKPDRITAVGYGEDRPLVSNDTRAGREQNRRIDFKISEVN
ncbi:MAG: OmpA family protein [Gammaproteobacteria bacterium]|nr:OmpA family protein [Gammaproteobacteria bacterium]